MLLRAYAKINLTLDILGKLPNSYHEIDSIMQSVSVYDTLEITKSEKIAVICDNSAISFEDNICRFAAKAFFDFCKINGGCKIVLNKNIPICAGLGGGSADAAAVITALDRIYDTKLTVDSLIKIAKSVGADVPFCLIGGTCRVGGIGEKVQKLIPIPKTYFVIIKVGEKQSTGEMYRRIDSLKDTKPYTEDAVSALNCGDYDCLLNCVSNAFQYVCDTKVSYDTLSPFNPLKICLSGSGPSVYAMFADKNSAKRCADTLNESGITAYICESREKSIEIE